MRRHGESLLKTALPTREAVCPHCERTFTAALRAVQLRCPGCQRPLRFENADITRPTRENISTLGDVCVRRKGSLHGRIECGSLHVEGALVGEVRVRGEARIENGAAVEGALHADRLAIMPGGQLRGHLILNMRDDGASPLRWHTDAASRPI